MTKSAPQLGTLLQDRAARVDMIRRADPEDIRTRSFRARIPLG